MKKKITIVLLLLGRYELQVVELDRKLKEMELLQKRAEIVIVGDTRRWETAPIVQMFRVNNPDITVCFCEETGILPAKAMNMALPHIKTDYVMFCLLDDPIDIRFNQFCDAMCAEQEKENNWQSDKSYKTYYVAPILRERGELLEPIPQNLYGWTLNSQDGFCLGSFCVPKDILNAVCKIDENPLLQSGVERWFSLKVLKLADPIRAGMDNRYVKRLSEYPGITASAIPSDMENRYIAYGCGIAADERTPEKCAADFANDLNDADAELYRQISGIVRSAQTQYHTHYKILIVGGEHEYHHNQICFFNYLERLYGKGFATYRTVFEYKVPANIVLGYDLVIFTRCRSKNALRMMRLAEQHDIATLYMIDDNWLTIAKDHPDMGEIFVPGNENYDNFIEALGLCRATWLFNDILREDVLPYTRCVKKFKISVDPRQFEAKSVRSKKNGELVIGFSGSLRYDDVAFRALARYARRHSDVTVLLMGVLSREQELLFKNVNTIRIDFSSYGRYAQRIAEIQPDLLVAPLDDTHTLNSKCFNKYIEAGVTGAACIFSHCRPYTDVVREGVNGFFVRSETAEAWYQKLEEVLADIPELRRVQKNVKSDVMNCYTVDALLNSFCEKINQVIKGELNDD